MHGWLFAGRSLSPHQNCCFFGLNTVICRGWSNPRMSQRLRSGCLGEFECEEAIPKSHLGSCLRRIALKVLAKAAVARVQPHAVNPYLASKPQIWGSICRRARPPGPRHSQFVLWTKSPSSTRLGSKTIVIKLLLQYNIFDCYIYAISTK
jgi:hypothetical protein